VKPRSALRAGSAEATHVARFAADVRYYLGLQPRQLPSKYLYDDLGSALFEAITCLPWYSLARAEGRLIHTRAREIFAAVTGISTIVELGAGNGTKLAALVEAAAVRQMARVHLIDVSESALAAASALLSDAQGISEVIPHWATYEDGLAEVAPAIRQSGRALALFFGSNIGNFDPPACDALLHTLRAALRPRDALLLGADLIKPERDLLLAYDDPLQVTAAFNRNLIVRINRELGATFDLDAFDHRATWNPQESRVEMHLVSRKAARVMIPAAHFELEIEAGETIWTESSYKYEADALDRMLRRSGFDPIGQWIDERDRFVLVLAEVSESP